MNTIVSRLSRVRAVITRYQGDPYLRGRALQVAGGALLADSLVGLENPLDGRDKRPGILGALFVAAVGVFFLFAGSLMSDNISPYADGVTTVGTITSVQRGTGESSNRCSGTVTYTVDGRQYQARTSSSSTTLCSREGTAVDVSYRPSAPAAGRAQLPGDQRFLRILPIVGWGVLALGVLLTLTRLAELVVGLWALVRGRRLVRTNPATPADALLDELHAAWSGTAPRAFRP